MKLTITTYDCKLSQGYISQENPVAIAFKRAQPNMDYVKTAHGRLTAYREGYPVRFLIKNFTVADYRKLSHTENGSHECILEPLPVSINELQHA